jgi:hypothetical protein
VSVLEDILKRLARVEERLSALRASGPMAGVLSAQVAATDSIVDIARIERTTTGTAANGIGVGEVFILQDAAGNVEESGNIDVVLTTAAHAAQAAAMRLGVSGTTVLSLTTGKASAGQLESTVAVGTAPLAVTSTTVCANLNADTVDGIHGHAAITLGDHADHLLTLTGQALTTPNTNANVVYAGPASGAATSADWRALVDADLPTGPTFNHIHLTTDLAVAEGGTGVSTLALNGILFGNDAAAVGVTAVAGSQYRILTVGASPFVPLFSSYLLDGTAGGKTVLAVTNAKTLTITAADTYNLTIQQTLTLAGASGKVLTLTDSLTNEGGNAGILHWDAAATLTIPATGTAALLGTANVFTAAQEIQAASQLRLTTTAGSVYCTVANDANNGLALTFVGTVYQNMQLTATKVNTGTLADGFAAGISEAPTYNAAYTVTRHNYINLSDAGLTGSAVLTDAAVFRFNANTGTHKALASNGAVASVFTANAGPTGAATAIQGWMKINVSGTLRYIPYW